MTEAADRRGFGATRALAIVAPLAIYLVAAFVMFASAWSDPAHRIIGFHGDTSDFVWFMRWFAFAVEHGHNPFVTTYLNYPGGINLLWNTSIPLVGLLVTPVTLAFGPVVSYNLAITVAPALSAWTAFLALRRYVASATAAAVGGLLYGFSPVIVAQALGHSQVALAFTPPLVLLLLDDLLVRQQVPAWRPGVLLGLVAAAQLLVGEETLASEAMVAAIGIVILGLLHRDQVRARAGHALRGIGLAGAVAAAVAAFPLWIQFFGPQRTHGVAQAPNQYLTDLLNFVIPTGLQHYSPPQAVAVAQQFSGSISEWDGYLGLPLVVVCAFTAVRWWRAPAVRFFALLGGVVALLSLGPQLHIGGLDTHVPLPFAVIDRLPLLANLLPDRLAMYVALSAAALLALFMERVVRTPRPAPRAAGALTVAAVIAALLPALPYPFDPASTPAFFRGQGVARIEPDSVALVAPYTFDQNSVESILWQAESGMRYKMPSGYLYAPGGGTAQTRIGPAPHAVTDRLLQVESGQPGALAVDASARRLFLRDLNELNVRTVIVGPMSRQEDVLRFFSNLLGTSPESTEGVYAWFSVPPPS